MAVLVLLANDLTRLPFKYMFIFFELDEDVAAQIAEDQEFNQLNAIIQQDIQSEIMMSIKWKLNGRQDTVQRVKRMMDIIDFYSRNKANEDKKNMAEISDYLQNYSDMTFNEYKQMKSAK